MFGVMRTPPSIQTMHFLVCRPPSVNPDIKRGSLTNPISCDTSSLSSPPIAARILMGCDVRDGVRIIESLHRLKVTIRCWVQCPMTTRPRIVATALWESYGD